MQDKLETRWVEAAVGGDIDSFGELCQRHYAAMVAIGYSILGDHQLAEDAAQESFARALVQLRRLRKKARFAPWLAAICRNVAKDMVATKARQINNQHFSPAAADEDTDETSRVVRQAIERLPAPAKELLILRYYNGLSYDEISSVLGISKATINGRLARAKRQIAGYLGRSGFMENEL